MPLSGLQRTQREGSQPSKSPKPEDLPVETDTCPRETGRSRLDCSILIEQHQPKLLDPFRQDEIILVRWRNTLRESEYGGKRWVRRIKYGHEY